MDKEEKLKNKDFSLFHYRGYIPAILAYQVVSKAVFAITMLVLKEFSGFLLWNLGRPAFTSGDLPYLMRSWQGWCLIVVGFLMLVVYTIFDVNATILISGKIVHNEPIKAIPIMKDAFKKSVHFRSFRGVLIILYISLITPLTGTALGISLTSGFAIPEFIMSFINDRFVLKFAYNALLLVLAVIGFLHVFTFHFILLGDMDVLTALRRSREIMKKYWRDFIKRYLAFVIKAVLYGIILALLVYVIPLAVVLWIRPETVVYHIAIVFISVCSLVVFLLFSLLTLYFTMMKLTLMYERYTDCDTLAYRAPEKKKHFWFGLAILGSTVLIFLFSVLTGWFFDECFPAVSTVETIAHRAGGELANENTILGMEAAIENCASYSEIDVQRTADGHYVINHDDTFERVCGDPRTPGEMTLAEVKQLEVVNQFNPLEPTTEVATIEEFLDGAKDRIGLLIELKGVSADPQMAEDIYRMVKERDMVDQVMFISLKYDLLDYVEQHHPEIDTGYLCFFGFGNIARMGVDVLLLEAETATETNIDKVHKAGKKVGVWTVDSYTAMLSFMNSNADYIITDKVAETNEIREILQNRPDVVRVLQMLLP